MIDLELLQIVLITKPLAVTSRSGKWVLPHSDLRPCDAQLQKPPTRQNTSVHHVGLYAKNPTASAECYRDLVCRQVVGGSEFAQLGGPLILLREPSPPLDIGPNP